MGAVKQSNAIFLTIADGKISRRFQQPTADSITRTTKTGKVVHEEFYKAWKGRIVDIKFQEHPEFGRFLNLSIEDEDGTAIIQMKQGSGYATAFLKMLPNIDLYSEITFTPSMKMDGEKKKTSVFINQNGETVKWAYTRENPNGCPELKKIKVKGKDVWDDSDIVEFLENMVNADILPQLSGVKATVAQAVGNDTEDDMPF